jgi:hypothetical protein
MTRNYKRPIHHTLRDLNLSKAQIARVADALDSFSRLSARNAQWAYRDVLSKAGFGEVEPLMFKIHAEAGPDVLATTVRDMVTTPWTRRRARGPLA